LRRFDFRIGVMDPGGGDVIRLTDNRRADLLPDWQPLP
jgi:hypothetical protein